MLILRSLFLTIYSVRGLIRYETLGLFRLIRSVITAKAMVSFEQSRYTVRFTQRHKLASLRDIHSLKIDQP